MGLPERPAIRLKGLRIVVWRGERGRGLDEARMGRKEVRMKVGCIVIDDGLSSYSS